MEEVAQAQITALCTGKDCRREALDDLTLDGRVKSAGPVKGLDNLPALKSLSLACCNVNSLNGFPTLPALKRLNLSDNPISGGLEYLVSACPALESLELSNTKLTSVAALAPLAQLSHLRRLDVRYCPLASGSLGTQVQSLLPQLASLIDDDEDEDFEDEDEEEDEDEGDEEEGDDDGDEEEEDDSPGTAFLLHGNADDLADEDDFAGEEEPESEDIDEEEGDEDEDGDAAAAAAKKPRTQ